MKILITGCAGFIGTHFTRYLLEKYPSRTVIGVDSLTYAADVEALAETRQSPNFVFYHADICDKEAMTRIFTEHRPDVVVNFAAESHVDRSIEGPDAFIRTNVLGTGVLLDLALAYQVSRFHQVSTDEVYGDMPLESTARFDEKAPLAPNSPYSASKAAADLLVLSYARTYGLPVSISRSSNNYGAFQHAEKLIPKSILCAIQGECIPLYGDGKNQRSWIYVLDHCRAVDLILEEGRAGEIYNVASKVELSNIELIQRLLALLDAPRDGFVFVEDRRGHDRSYPIDTTKIERELGFFPTTLWEDGIRQTIAHYLNKYKK